MCMRNGWFALLVAAMCVACAPRADIGTPPPPTTGPPPVAAAEPSPPAPARPASAPDTTCGVASDCAVKNVGNCCGYFPACVAKDSPVDPDAVRAECERSGMSSVCGFRDIQACDCVQGQCQAVESPLKADR